VSSALWLEEADPSARVARKLLPNVRRLAGVSRIASLTGLDRTGVEVAAAIRPDGHVLQLCNGKGLTFERAAMSALMEACELWAAETISPGALRFSSSNALVAEEGAHAVLGPHDWEAAELLQVGALWHPDVVLAWRRGLEAISGKAIWVPACLAHCPPSEGTWLGPQPLRWTSNGMGAHPTSAARAQRHALLELLERDTLARAFPEGMTEASVMRALLSRETLHAWAPRTAKVADALERQGFEVHLLDVTDASVVKVPVAAAVLLDKSGRAVPVAAGYACETSFDEAALGALLEAGQTRLTDIQGAREDVTAMEEDSVQEAHALFEGARPRRRPARSCPRTQARSTRDLVRTLEKAGAPGVVFVALEGPGVHVSKAVVPGLLLSELL
jgi:ribosomal protein S12 methylthiotransferase accessory factor